MPWFSNSSTIYLRHCAILPPLTGYKARLWASPITKAILTLLPLRPNDHMTDAIRFSSHQDHSNSTFVPWDSKNYIKGFSMHRLPL
jgi:hypothetical protein